MNIPLFSGEELRQQLVFHVRCMFPLIRMVGKQQNKFLPKAIFVTYFLCPSSLCCLIQDHPGGWAAPDIILC